MNLAGTRLLPIGHVARVTLLSVKALRLYDQLGVLTPAYTDPDSGYRYYHADQLRDARLIRAMRQIGMPLATIRRVLAVAPAEAEALLDDYLRAMEARVAQARCTVPDLVSALHKEEIRMSLPEVHVRTEDSQPIVSVTHHVKVDKLDRRIRESLTTLRGFVEDQGGTVTGAPFGLYHGPINAEEDGPIEVCVPVERELPGGEIASRVLPGGRVAYAVLRGDECAFPDVLKGYDAVYDWIAGNGYEAEDAPREIWRSGPEDQQAELEVSWRFHTPADA